VPRYLCKPALEGKVFEAMVFIVTKNTVRVSVNVFLELVPLRVKNNFKAHPQNRILEPLSGSFQNFRRASFRSPLLGTYFYCSELK